MSALKLYEPSRLTVYHEDEPAEDGPVILQFPAEELRYARQTDRLVDRIRLIRQNRFCPSCGKSHVQPVSSEAALRSRDQMPVPGSGYLVGFKCCQCGHRWTT